MIFIALMPPLSLTSENLPTSNFCVLLWHICSTNNCINTNFMIGNLFVLLHLLYGFKNKF